MLGEIILGDDPLGFAPDPAAASTSRASLPAMFVSSEAIDNATLTALTKETSLPVENLQTLRPDETYRSTSATDQYIDITLAEAVALTAFAVTQPNASSFSDGAVWRAIGAISQANIPLAPDVDTGLKRTWPSTGKPTTKEAFLTTFLLFANETKCKYWRLYISDMGRSYLDLGRLFAARAFRPSTNIDLTPTMTRTSPNYVAWSEYGHVFTDNRGANRRSWQVPVSSLNEDEMMQSLDELEIYCGVDRDVAVCLDPGATANLQKYTFQALFAQNSQRVATPLWTSNDVQLWQTQILLNEVT